MSRRKAKEKRKAARRRKGATKRVLGAAAAAALVPTGVVVSASGASAQGQFVEFFANEFQVVKSPITPPPGQQVYEVGALSPVSEPFTGGCTSCAHPFAGGKLFDPSVAQDNPGGEPNPVYAIGQWFAAPPDSGHAYVFEGHLVPAATEPSPIGSAAFDFEGKLLGPVPPAPGPIA